MTVFITKIIYWVTIFSEEERLPPKGGEYYGKH